MQQQFDWNETQGLFNELTTVYSHSFNDDKKHLDASLAILKEVKDMYHEKQSEIKRAITGLTKDLSDVIESFPFTYSEEALKEKLDSLNKIKDEMKNGIEKSEIEHIKTMNEITQIKNELESIKQKSIIQEKDSCADIPLIRYSVSLYANVTNIKWDYESDRISGTIATPNDLKSFDINPNQSQFHIANEIWSLLD